MMCMHEKMKDLSGQRKYNFALRAMPHDERYKLFIDSKRLANPSPQESLQPRHLLFDVNEPGYYQAMMKAFKLMSHRIGVPPSLALVTEFHNQAVDGVRRETGHSFKKGLELLIKWGYPVAPNELATAKMELWKSRILAFPDLLEARLSHQKWTKPLTQSLVELFSEDFLASYNPDEGLIESFSCTGKGSLRAKLTPYFDHYRESIVQVKSLRATLLAIAELIRTLEVSHHFPDGNQRTNAFILLNKLLIDNNLPPAILENPAMFDGIMDLNGMTQAIYNGITNYLNETEINQRVFLREECADIDSTSEAAELFLKGSGKEYTPFFILRGPNTVVSEKKKFLRAITKKSIETHRINTSRIEGRSLLFLSIILQDEELRKLLLISGADPSIDDREAIDAVAQQGRFKLAKRMSSMRPEKRK